MFLIFLRSIKNPPFGVGIAHSLLGMALSLAFVEACHEKNCPVGTIFVPELRGKFIATGKFYETSKVPSPGSIKNITGDIR